MSTMTKATQQELQEYLSYAPNTGILIWLKRPSRKIHEGERAGSLDPSGYRYLYFKGKRYPEHHIIWCLVYGDYPPHQIDHIDQNRSNNKLNNLRAVTKAQNARNRSRANSTLDEVGIWYCKRRHRYIAEITMDGKKVYQKSFTDIDQAIQERKAKALELGFHDNHGKSNQSNRKYYD